MGRLPFLLLALMIAGMLLSSCAQSNITKEQAITIATEHLQQYGYYRPDISHVKVEEGEGWVNYYWERVGQPSVKSEAKRICWVVRFHYPGLAEGSHLIVFVDKRSGKVIGGTQTK